MITEAKKRDVALVVDDSPETLRLLTDALDGAGMTVMVALDGAAAMRIVDQITPDIVLLDAVMPGLDGFETCRRLKRDAGLDHVPIIFMTGLAETEHIVRGLEAGGVDYVTKPIAVEEMLARIRVHLANARLTQSARAALDVSGRYLLAVNSVGKIMWATPQAQKLLSDVLSPDSDDDVVLPDPIPQWLDQARKGKAGSKAAIMTALPGDEQLRLQYMGRLGTNTAACKRFRRRCASGILQRAWPDDARGRSAVVAVEGQDQPRHRANSGLEPAHRRQAPRANLLETRRREPHRSGGDRGEREASKILTRDSSSLRWQANKAWPCRSGTLSAETP